MIMGSVCECLNVSSECSTEGTSEVALTKDLVEMGRRKEEGLVSESAIILS